MTSTTRIATMTAAALAAGALSSKPASASHAIGHTVATVKQDARELGERADAHAAELRETADRAGAGTRQAAQAIVRERMRSTSRTVSDTRASAQATVEERSATLQRRANRSRSTAMRRSKPLRDSAGRSAGSATAQGHRAAREANDRKNRAARRARATVAPVLVLLENRAAVLAGRLSGTLAALLEGGTVVASLTGIGTYSAGWSRTGGCWTLQVATPLEVLGGRKRHRIGTSAEPMPGHRSSASAQNGGVKASTGC